jgi:hypothetical protein
MALLGKAPRRKWFRLNDGGLFGAIFSWEISLMAFGVAGTGAASGLIMDKCHAPLPHATSLHSHNS